MRAVHTRAPAKVNLALRILAREEDGYHQLETLFQALDLTDEVWVRPAPEGIRLRVEGPEPCAPEDNLAHRAAAAFLQRAGITQGVEIYLRKRLPAGGGLGGGSSDAAATLKALNHLFEGEFSEAGLADLAASLGADVSFFLSPSPLALAWGRGDRMLPLPPLPQAPVLLAVPGFGVSTPEAFRRVAESRRSSPQRPVGVLSMDRMRSWPGVSDLAENDFHGPVFGMAPVLGDLHAALVESGPRLALLSGSGSTLFAVYDSDSERDDARARMEARFPDVSWRAATTLAAMPPVEDGMDWPRD